MTNTIHIGTSTEVDQPYRGARHAANGEHICPQCIRPGDLIDVLDVTLYVHRVEPYTHPAIVTAGQTWAITSDRPPHEFRGITLCQATLCPFQPVPGRYCDAAATSSAAVCTTPSCAPNTAPR